MTFIWTGEVRAVESPFPSGTVDMRGVAISYQDLGTIAVCLVAVAVLWAFFQFTKVGLALRAAAVNPEEARLVGVRVSRMLGLGWGLAAMLGAIAGALTAPTVFLDPSMMQAVLIYAFAAAVLGGIDSPIGAVVGGLLGALAGGLVGNYHDQQEKNLAETRRDYAGYDAAKGTRLKIERVRTNPPSAAPGDTVEIQLTYAVLTPREDVMVPVRESREILFEGSKVGEASVDIEREGGTWRSVVPITLPGNARPGNYRVVASVESRGGGKDIEEITFRVHR